MKNTRPAGSEGSSSGRSHKGQYGTQTKKSKKVWGAWWGRGVIPGPVLGALLHLQLLSSLPASSHPALLDHTQLTVCSCLSDVYSNMKKRTKNKDQERKNKNLEYVGILNLFCPWDKVSILRGGGRKQKNCYNYLVTYCSLYFWKVDYIRDEIGPMVAQIKMGFMIGWKLFI